MHYSLNRIAYFILLLALLFISNLGFSQDEHFLDLVVGDIQPGVKLIIEDDKLYNSSKDYNMKFINSIKNRISIELIHESIPQDFPNSTFTFELSILVWDTPPPVNSEANSEWNPTELTETLELSYDGNVLNATNSKAFFEFEGAVKVEVEVFNSHVVPISSVLPQFEFRGDTYIDRTYEFSDNTESSRSYDLAAISQTIAMATPIDETGTIEIKWINISGALEYDVEWTFYDIKSGLNINCDNCSLDQLYKNNASRITTDQISYYTPNLYPEGYFFYRVRGVRYDEKGIREYTSWSTEGMENIPSNAYLLLDWHEKDLNWQSQVSFAEQGKHVPSVNYFDGSLRQRQSVTFSNAIGHPILQQNIYDHLGRPTISVMASPDLNKDKIEFDPLFAASSATEIYTKENITDTNGCLIPPPAMDNSKGASNYFSAENPFKAGVNKFIPEAEGYVFSTNEYMPDLTGRMRRQSGVGKTFQLDTDHETKYYYGKASEEELFRIFEDQVGSDDHYQKNMVQDPNGQLSVSYLDAHGRTIATSLAGESPDNTVILDSKKESTDIQYDLLSNIRNNNSQVSTYTMLVSDISPFTFNYHVDPKTAEFACLPIDTCYDCVYDLIITIDDNCGNIFNNGEKILVEKKNVSLESLPLLCSDQNLGIDFSTIVPASGGGLPIGEYKITKVLTVSQVAAEEYLSDFLSHTTCLPTYENIYESVLTNIDTTGCDNVESEDVVLTECDLMKELLLLDVQPGGLSAPYEYDEDNILIVNDGLLFDSEKEEYEFKFQEYFEDSEVFQNGTEFLQINRMSQDQFIEFFQTEWAENLIEGHDLIDCHKSCLENKEIGEYVLGVQNTTTFEAAISKGYIDQLTCQPNFLDQPGFECLLWRFYILDFNITFPMNLVSINYNGEEIIYNSNIENANSFIQILFDVTGLVWDVNSPYSFSYDDLGDISTELYNSLIEMTFQTATYELDTEYVPTTVNCTYDDYLNEKFACRNIRTSYNIESNLSFPVTIEDWYLNENSVPLNIVASNIIELRNMLNDKTGYSWSISPSKLSFEAPCERNVEFGQLNYSFNNGNAIVNGSSSPSIIIESSQYSISNLLMPYIDNFNQAACISHGAVDVLNSIVYCDGEAPCFTEFGKGCETDNNLAWNLYKNIFLTRHNQLLSDEYCNYQKFMTNYVNNNFEEFESPTLYEDDEEFNLYPPDPEDVDEEYLQAQKDANISIMLEECAANCELQAAGWLSQISPCWGETITASEIELIENRLIAVCKNGCDALRPFGASTCETPTDGEMDMSFEGILSSIMGSEFSECDLDCNPKMINFPPPHNVDPYFGNRTVSLVSQGLNEEGENCMCDNLVEMESCYSNYIADNNGEDEFGSLSAYLDQFATVSIDQSTLDTLSTYCTNDCNALPIPILLPPYMECDVCKTPDEVAEALLDFNPSLNCSPTDEEIIEELRALHLNAKFGYKLPAEEITSFLAEVATYPNRCHLLCPATFFGDYPINPTACMDELIENVEFTTAIIYENKLDSIKEAFMSQYLSQCIQPLDESFTADGTFGEHHFTLYYYDQAGNLVQTIAPEGTMDEEDVIKSPDEYEFKTNYKYNTFNQVVEQLSPDTYLDFNGNKVADDNEHMTTKFWYDNVGRVVASQDGRQKPIGLFSFTLYDPLGRITEVGEIPIANLNNRPNDQSGRDGSFSLWVSSAPEKKYVTKTYYDKEKFQLFELLDDDFSQNNLRNRVVSVSYEVDDDQDDNTYDSATHYNYDVTGNVKTLIQEITELHAIGHGYKRMDYNYDYISGNVNAIFYQKGLEDQYTHRYIYDENNRLVDVKTSAVETGETSHNRINPSQDWQFWDNEVSYEYYDHGALARSVLGENKVQGCDYAYTLQGWVKGVNSSIVNPKNDMGADGVSTIFSPIAPTAVDVYGYTIGYFNNDYEAISENSNFEANYTDSYFESQAPSLYNGNIRNMVVDIKALSQPIGYTYNYDQLHRIKSMDSHKNIDATNNSWVSVGDDDDSFLTNYDYDANGNIQNLHRYGSTVQEDFLVYSYDSNSNRLNQVIDRIAPNRGNSPGYISHHSTFKYDGSGNMTSQSENRSGDIVTNTIEWTPYGKVDRVVTPNRETTFGYGPDQNRISKTVLKRDAVNNEICNESQYVFTINELADLFGVDTYPVRVGGLIVNGINVMTPDENGSTTFTANSGDEFILKMNSLTDYRWSFNNLSEPYFKENEENEFGEDISSVLNLQIGFLNFSNPSVGTLYPFREEVEIPCDTESSAPSEMSTYYIRDAQGNVMGVYQVEDEEIIWKEQHIYGSSRLGLVEQNIILQQEETTPYYNNLGQINEGQKRYELSNHLGNVLAVISDRKTKKERLNTEYYEPTVISAQDYFPFGQEMGSDRSFSSSSAYRYGFNGKEKDTEGEWGSQTHYDFGERIYNPSIGRFLSVDPYASIFPNLNPYQFAGNSPLSKVDVDGGYNILYIAVMPNSKVDPALIIKKAQSILDDLGLGHIEVRAFNGSLSEAKIDYLDATDFLAIVGNTTVETTDALQQISKNSDEENFLDFEEVTDLNNFRTQADGVTPEIATDMASPISIDIAKQVQTEFGAESIEELIAFLAVHAFGHDKGEIMHGGSHKHTHGSTGFMGEGSVINVYTVGVDPDTGEPVYPNYPNLSSLFQDETLNKKPTDAILKNTSDADSDGNIIVRPAEDNYEKNKNAKSN